MVARVTHFEGTPEQLQDGVRIFVENVLPWLRDATGFRGWVALLDREHDRALGVTFWADEQSAEDGAASGGPLRDEIAESVGALMRSMELWDVMHAELAP